MRRHRLYDPLGQGTRSDPLRIDWAKLCGLSVPAPTLQQTIHIRSQKNLNFPPFCGAEGSEKDWLNWDQLPGSPHSRGGIFPLLCETCFDLYQAAKKKG